MRIIGPDELVFGVDNRDACEAFLTDFGLTATGDGRFEALDKTAIRLCASDDPDLPAPLPTNSWLRQTIGGVEDQATLDAIETELSKDRDVAKAADGTLFVTVGERGKADLAQSLGHHNGTVVRVARDGTVPSDNPFVGQDGALPEIWSYGHRNPQGAAMDGDGRLWAVEHGARGGDEINRIEPGTNYGWPEISYGTNYNGSKIGVGTEAEGMAQPEHFWDPSIAPSGMAILSDAIPGWGGHFVIGSLKFDSLHVLDPEDWSEEVIRTRETARVRDVAEAPDGSVWFISEDRGAIYRLAPAD